MLKLDAESHPPHDDAVPAALDNVSRRYGSTVALDAVSMTVGRGEIVALLGPNGAGKTSAVRLLLGLAAPDSGRVRIFGRDPRAAGGRSRTGALLQVGKVPETLRVREHIHLFSSYYPDPLPLSEVIEAAGLKGLEHRQFGDLSGGQQQRVLFGLSICGNPDFLVLDEPTVGLDVEARRAMWAQIRRFASRGRAVLLTTHYLEEADALADRVILIDRGRTVADGTPAQIKEKAAGRQIRCSTSLTVLELANLEGVARVTREGARTIIETSDPDELLRTLFVRDPHLRDIEVAGAALEDAFLALTGNR